MGTIVICNICVVKVRIPRDHAGGSHHDTNKEAQDIDVPFATFVPTLFARSVPGRKLNTREINTVQLTLSKFEYDNALNPAFTEGAFRLDIDAIEAY